MIGKRIKELRTSLKLSMPEFGRRLGCTRDVIANIEYGRVEPKQVFLDHLCEIFSVNPDWLYQGQGDMMQENTQPDDEQIEKAVEILRILSPELKEWAYSQLASLQKMMEIRAEKEQGRDMQLGTETIELMVAMSRAERLPKQNQGSEKGQTDLGQRLGELMQVNMLSAQDLAVRAHLPETEIKELLASKRRIGRGQLIALCIAMKLGVEEAQALLTASGLPALYAENRRDSACIFALMKGLSVNEVNELLEALDEPQL